MIDSNVKRVRDAIKRKVDEIGSLNGTFDYDTGKNEGYPFAIVVPSNGTSAFGDSKGNNRGRDIQTMRFVIRVFQEREEHLFGAEKAENVALTALDEILTAFHSDTTLSGTVLWQRPTDWNADYEVRDQVVRALEITIEAVKEIDTNV